MLRILVITIGGLMLIAVGLVAYEGLQPAVKTSGPAAAETQVAIIAAAHAVRAGSLLQPDDIGRREVPQDKLPPGAQLDTSEARNALIGAMLRRMLGEHDVIASDDVLRPGDRGFLAAVLAPGSRAISVAVDSVSGEAGLIWPGDRVDLILTQTIEATDQSLAHRVSGETVLDDVRVIAVDQQLVQGGQASGLLQSRGPSLRTITLEVTPENAARVAVATRLGKLLVVLRSAQPAALAADEPLLARPPPAAGRDATVPVVASAPIPAPARPAGADSPVAMPSAPAASAAAGPVWGGDVSHALGNDTTPRGPEVRLYQGTKQVEAYKF